MPSIPSSDNGEPADTLRRDFDAFASTFRLDELEIWRNGSWIWSVRPDQVTLGSTVLSLARPCAVFSDINSEEGARLADAVTVVEAALAQAFEPDRMNYLMLMMVDHHVHFHVIPRYSGSPEFSDSVWVDNGWPNPPDIAGGQNPNDSKMLAHIVDRLKSAADTITERL